MSEISDAAKQLRKAADVVAGVRVHREPGASIDPPAVVVGPPRLNWETAGVGPTSATFIVYVIVAFNDRSMDTLWEFVPQVADAIESSLDAAVVQQATPTLFQSGGQDLPTYELTVDYAL